MGGKRKRKVNARMIKELPQLPLTGALNVNVFVASQSGTLLQKNPKDNPHILRSIAHEYHFLGYTDRGGTFRKRSPQEQNLFCRYCASHGLRVLQPIFVDDRGRNHYPFLNNALTLNKYLPNVPTLEAQIIVYQLFEDLRKAHRKGIVYGDRWSENILVVPNMGLVHIDFDIEISGKPAIELEVAQAVYYSLCGGKDKVLSLLGAILGKSTNWFDFKMVELFLSRHAIHFRNSPTYGGVEKETQALIEIANSYRNASQ